MNNKLVMAQLSESPLDVARAITDVSDPECGGIASFVGTVRNSAAVGEHADKAVVRLEYEAHDELARARLNEIAEAATSKWDVRRLVAIHRLGSCELGEPTVVVACAAPHRGDALEACRWVIDEIKGSVPIWKKEVYADGSAWVGAEGEGA